MEISLKHINQKWIAFVLLSLVFFLAIWITLRYLPINCQWGIDPPSCVGSDWRHAYRPMLLAMLSGQSPYTGLVFNPPWIFAGLLPFALLPPDIGTACLLAVSLVVFIIAVYRMGANPFQMIAFLLSPPVMFSLQGGNVDWLVLLGATLPIQSGMFLILAKPQSSAGLGLYWLWETWRKGQWREIGRVFAPVAIVTLISFVLYGNWITHSTILTGTGIFWNDSLFPASIPIGLIFLFFAFRQKKPHLALAAAPFLSPYVGLGSWSVVLFGTIPQRRLFWVCWIAFWIMHLVGRF